MSLDLSAAVEAVMPTQVRAYSSPALDSIHRAKIRRVLEVAAPHIEAQVRAQVVAELVDYTDAVLDLVDTQNGARLAFIEIVRIAREGRES